MSRTARAFLAALVLHAAFSAAVAAQEPDTPASGDLRRHEHSGPFPFYSRERYEDGSERHSSLFGAIRGEWLANGDYRHRVVPFYQRIVRDQGNDRALAIYPLLYWRLRSPAEDHDFVLPLVYWWRTAHEESTILWPLAHVADKAQAEPFRFVPTLLASGAWQSGSQQRFGVPLLLDLFERSEDDALSAWTVGALFPWGPPAHFGLPLAKSRRGKEHGDWHLHVAPLFFAGEGPEVEAPAQRSGYLHTPFYGTWSDGSGDGGTSFPILLTWWSSASAPERSSVNVVYPIFRRREEPERSRLQVLPFYAIDERRGDEAARTDHYFPLALARLRRGEQESATDVLFPLFHVSKKGDAHALRVLPFYDEGVDGGREWFGLGGFVYRRHSDAEDSSVAHWLLFPIGLHSRSPQEEADWLLPIYLHREATQGDERDTRTLVLPFYVQRTDERRGEDGTWRKEIEWLHLWPLYGHHHYGADAGAGERDSYFTLAPFFRLRRERSAGSSGISESRVDAPWPLLKHEWTRDAWDFRLFPVAFAGDDPERSYLRLYPALSVETGPAAKSGGFAANTSVVQWYEDGSETRFRLFPALFQWKETQESREVTGPLWWFRYSERADNGWFHLLPLGYGAWEGEESRAGIFPLFFRRQFGARPIERWSLGRWLFAWNSLRGKDEAYDSFLWKVVEYSRSSAPAAGAVGGASGTSGTSGAGTGEATVGGGSGGDYDFRILHRLVVNRHVQGQREIVVNPFFRSTKDAWTGRESFSILGFLYRSKVEGGVRTRRVLGIPF